MNTLQRIGCGVAAGLAAFTCAPDAHGQWAAATHNFANPILADGFQVVHDDGVSLQAFSAVTQAWNAIGPTGSVIHGVGDWVTLFQGPGGQIAAYSARLDTVTPAPFLGATGLIVVEDDVALVIQIGAAGLAAHGYSAQTGSWDSVPLATAMVGGVNSATSRFVVGIRDTNQLLGFSARRALWVAQPVANAAPPVADGNVLAADVSAGGSQRVAAFSGALGAWALSPPRDSASVTTIDHNVLHFTRPGPGALDVRDVGYSAYTGAFTSNPVLRNLQIPVTVTTADNLVYVEEQILGIGQHAFGARPAAWATAPSDFTLLGMGEDSLVLFDGEAAALGFSGLFTGVFVPQPMATLTPGYLGPADHLSAVLDGPELRMFSPAYSAWAPPAPVPTTSTIVVDDAVAAVIDPTGALPLVGYATRHNSWTSATTPAIVTIDSAGSTIALQDAAGDTWFFAEGCNGFEGPHTVGGASFVRSGRNLTMLDSGGGLGCYSVQRESFDVVAGAVLPPAAPPVQQENVAFFVDALGAQVHAFGSPAPIHARNQWPRGTEYQSFGPVAADAADFFITVRAPGAAQNWLLWSTLHLCPGVAVLPAPSPPACLAAPTFVGPLGATPAGGAVELGFNLIGGPANFEVWLQGLELSAGGVPSLSDGCSPAWVF